MLWRDPIPTSSPRGGDYTAWGSVPTVMIDWLPCETQYMSNLCNLKRFWCHSKGVSVILILPINFLGPQSQPGLFMADEVRIRPPSPRSIYRWPTIVYTKANYKKL